VFLQDDDSVPRKAAPVGREACAVAGSDEAAFPSPPFEEAVSRGAPGPGVEGDPALLRVGLQVLEVDVPVAAPCVGEQERASLFDELGEPGGVTGVEDVVAESQVDTARTGDERDGHEQSYSRHHPAQADHDQALPASQRHGGWEAIGGIALVSRAVERHYRVVIAKPGLDGHDRGAKVIARALRDAGFEVIYTGLRQTPEQVAEAVMQEDADAVGLSLLSGAHMTLFPKVIDELRRRDLDDVVIFGGGIIPNADIPKLKEMGVGAIFTPGASMAAITDWLRQALEAREAQTSNSGT